MQTLFLDTETTGLDPRVEKIIEIAIVDSNGDTVLDTFVDPQMQIPESATAIHGIRNNHVRGHKTLEELWPDLVEILSGNHIVIYNSDFDRAFFPDYLNCANKISCAMKEFARYRGLYNHRYSNYRWHRLINAAIYVGHRWQGSAHRALSDALACRSVWNYLEQYYENRIYKELNKNEENYLPDIIKELDKNAKNHLLDIINESIEFNLFNSRNHNKNNLILFPYDNELIFNIFS